MKYQWIQKHQPAYPVSRMCRVLHVCPSSYYAWTHRESSPRQQRREQLAQQAAQAYFVNHRVYGYRKVWEELHEQDAACCPETVRRILQELGLFSRRKRRYVVTTDSNHDQPIADNVLNREFNATAPNEKWLADITYIPTRGGWVYLAAILDVFSRRIVGWSLSERIDTSLVQSAFEMAVLQRRPDRGLLHHSDRGVQYASAGYQHVLAEQGIVCSMSRKGNCWDNAMMESFFASLKLEWVHGKDYANVQAAREDIFQYLELFYNRRRRHGALGYISPVDFEKNYALNQEQAA